MIHSTIRRACVTAASVVSVILFAFPAAAQESVLIAPPDIPDFDRGRNVSVLERDRQDYDALGVRRGSFIFYPRLYAGFGGTTNVYLNDGGGQGDFYAVLEPSVDVLSDWSRHQLSVQGQYSARRYFDQSRRDQDTWFVNSLGRVDVGSNLTLTAEAQIAKSQESLFTGAVDAQVASLSSYERKTAIVRGQYIGSRSRTTISYDLNDFDFNRIPLTNGSSLSQRDRDRQIQRASALFEYAVSPSVSFYTKGTYENVDYDTLLRNGLSNLDSHGYRIVAGAHLDLSAFLRGGVAIGYGSRDYTDRRYRTVNGLLVEARLEYFPTELTTVLFKAHRLIDDSNFANNLGNTSAFFDNSVELRVDHELRRNVIINADIRYIKQDFVRSPDSSDIFIGSAGARYLVSRNFELLTSGSYSQRSYDGNLPSGKVKEFAGTVGVVIKR